MTLWTAGNPKTALFQDTADSFQSHLSWRRRVLTTNIAIELKSFEGFRSMVDFDYAASLLHTEPQIQTLTFRFKVAYAGV